MNSVVLFIFFATIFVVNFAYSLPLDHQQVARYAGDQWVKSQLYNSNENYNDYNIPNSNSNDNQMMMSGAYPGNNYQGQGGQGMPSNYNSMGYNSMPSSYNNNGNYGQNQQYPLNNNQMLYSDAKNQDYTN